MSQEHEHPIPANPEAAFHADVLRQKRRQERFSAIALSICCAIIFIGTVPLLVTSLFTHSPLPPLTLLILSLMTLAGVVGLATGLRELHSSALPVTTREIHQSRRQARIELLKLAQGYLPFSYRRIAIVLELVLACLLLLTGISYYVYPIITPNWETISSGTIFILASLMCFYDGFIRRPRVALRLAANSAQELSTRLALGEMTEGQEMDDM